MSPVRPPKPKGPKPKPLMPRAAGWHGFRQVVAPGEPPRWSWRHMTTGVRVISSFTPEGPDKEPGASWVLSVTHDNMHPDLGQRLRRLGDAEATKALLDFGATMAEWEELKPQVAIAQKDGEPVAPVRTFLRFIPAAAPQALSLAELLPEPQNQAEQGMAFTSAIAQAEYEIRAALGLGGIVVRTPDGVDAG